MEDRRSLHYHRNTVIVPSLGKKSIYKLMKKPLSGVPGMDVPQNQDPKICSTMVCPRCNGEQDRFRATCRRCHACFYCGLVGGSMFACHLCGNVIPEEDRDVPAQKVIRIA
jgi:hypothetical protein